MGLSYYKSITDGIFTYSLDMLVLKGSYNPRVSVESFWPNELLETSFLHGFKLLLSKFESTLPYEHYENFKFLTYADMWVVSCGSSSVRFMFGFRGYTGSEKSKWKIEFNPNKCLPNPHISELIRFVWFNSALPYISSFDLACDIPCLRSFCFLIKDNRKYSLIRKSTEDKTEYLGVRHSMGYSKLYNKTIESHLQDSRSGSAGAQSCNITRFECSCVLSSDSELFNLDEFKKHIPIVYILYDYQLTFNDLRVSSTDLLLLEHCLACPDALGSLPHTKRYKIQKLIDSCTMRVVIPDHIILYIYSIARGIIVD